MHIRRGGYITEVFSEESYQQDKFLLLQIYTDSAEAKVPAVLDYLATVVEAGCKFLVFAHHKQMIDSVHEYLLLSIRAGGVGLTLTAASTVIFAELAWTPGDLIQAEDRVHRIGQVSSVNIYYLLANDTVDDIIWDVVQSKLENLGQMLDGHEETLEVSRDENQQMIEASNKHGNKLWKKQETLDSFVKRCRNTVDEDEEKQEQQPKLKLARH
ncbi:SWI/SNF-related matrix-associated actin-dependent regulator of chromatin subfamily A-like protein 1 [Linum perenne]